VCMSGHEQKRKHKNSNYLLNYSTLESVWVYARRDLLCWQMQNFRAHFSLHLLSFFITPNFHRESVPSNGEYLL